MNYAADFVDFGSDRLVITFENAQSADPDLTRPGWGSKALIAARQSHLAVKSNAACWYQRPELPELLGNVLAEPDIAAIARRTTYGTSMGGFAALAYAGLTGADRVVSMAPQTTLDPALVPWEDRFERGRRLDWSGAFGDAARTLPSPAKAIVIFDPYLRADRAHVERLAEAGLVRLHAPFMGHAIPRELRRLRVLRDVFDVACGARLDRQAFYRKLRRRHREPHHLDRLASAPRVAKSPLFAAIVERHRRQSHPRTPPSGTL